MGSSLAALLAGYRPKKIPTDMDTQSAITIERGSTAEGNSVVMVTILAMLNFVPCIIIAGEDKARGLFRYLKLHGYQTELATASTFHLDVLSELVGLTRGSLEGYLKKIIPKIKRKAWENAD